MLKIQHLLLNWLVLMRKEKEKRLFTSADFERWLSTRLPAEQGVARRMVGILIDDPKIEPDSAAPLLEIVKGSVETVAFRELIEATDLPKKAHRISDEGTVVAHRVDGVGA